MFVKFALFLQADEAYNIGPAASQESYLRMDKIVEVAQKTGAQVLQEQPLLGHVSNTWARVLLMW